MKKDFKNKEVTIFEGNKIRRVWDDKKELWYFSVADVVQALTGQDDNYLARKYWNKLAQRLREEGSEVVTKCHHLKMQATGGARRRRYRRQCQKTN